MRKGLLPHIIAAVGLVIFSVLGLGCAQRSAVIIEETPRGIIQNVHFVEKDFDPLRIIYVTSTATIRTSDNTLIEGSPVTYEMLLREAEKLGADDIVNLRVDEVITRRDQSSTVITYTATALAIRYKD